MINGDRLQIGHDPTRHAAVRQSGNSGGAATAGGKATSAGSIRGTGSGCRSRAMTRVERADRTPIIELRAPVRDLRASVIERLAKRCGADGRFQCDPRVASMRGLTSRGCLQEWMCPMSSA